MDNSKKTRLFLFGLCGKMGRAICENSAAQNCETVGGFDLVSHPTLPTFSDAAAVNVPFDVIVDFSRPETLPSVIALARAKSAPVVLATTGYDETAQAQIDALAALVPVFQSGNMSVGVNVLTRLAELAVKLLGDGYDIEITEKHHNQKVDAPSGTAHMLANAVDRARGGGTEFVYGREGYRPRKKGEIGIHSVRGGTIVGEHEILFAGENETVTVTHSAQSRTVFVGGALRAAKFLLTVPAGKYDMNDLLKI